MKRDLKIGAGYPIYQELVALGAVGGSNGVEVDLLQRRALMDTVAFIESLVKEWKSGCPIIWDGDNIYVTTDAEEYATFCRRKQLLCRRIAHSFSKSATRNLLVDATEEGYQKDD